MSSVYDKLSFKLLERVGAMIDMLFDYAVVACVLDLVV